MENNELEDTLIFRYLSGDIDEEGRQQLLAWVNKDPENAKRLFVMKDIYEAGISGKLYEEAQTEAGWARLKEKIKDKKPYKLTDISGKKSARRVLYSIRKYAAIFLVGALLGFASFYLYFAGKGTDSAKNLTECKVETKNGERATAILPDGSIVKLNACSSITYMPDFGKKNRNLQLSGEGYFEVKTNADMPFTVQTSDLNIKAFGTKFNVKSYVDEDVVETTLVSGIVSIETNDNRNVITLKPEQVITIPKCLVTSNRKQEYAIRKITETNGSNQQSQRIKSLESQVKKSRELVLIDQVNPELYTSWKDDRWIVQSESLESLSKKIERKYDVTISIVGKSTGKYSFSGTLKNYPLEQILEVISLNAPVQCSVRERNVIIREDNQKKKKYENLIQLL